MYTVNCSTPPSINGILIEPYNDTTEAAVVYYNCAESNNYSVQVNTERRKYTCGSNGMWWSPSHVQGQSGHRYMHVP